MSSPDPVAWRYEPFARLGPDELYAIVTLRERVFVVEQTCPYQDADGLDPRCDHLWTASRGWTDRRRRR